jgi:hypothetical protein
MNGRELSLHREAVLVQAWRSGNIHWFVERARKYGQAEPRSIWGGAIVVIERRGPARFFEVSPNTFQNHRDALR